MINTNRYKKINLRVVVVAGHVAIYRTSSLYFYLSPVVRYYHVIMVGEWQEIAVVSYYQAKELVL